MLIYALCRQLSRVQFTHFLSSYPPMCQRGGQANFGNAKIFRAPVIPTPPYVKPTNAWDKFNVSTSDATSIAGANHEGHLVARSCSSLLPRLLLPPSPLLLLLTSLPLPSPPPPPLLNSNSSSPLPPPPPSPLSLLCSSCC